jgi:C_GCAxxG_C_C family probable redox protein
MEEAIKKGVSHFNSGYGCAEAVLMAVAESKGIKSDIIPRIATGFCGGMANTNGMCGAVSGGILAINLLLGRNSAEESHDANYKAIQDFLKKFESEFGSQSCPALTGVDLGTEEGQLEFKRKNQHARCADFVGSAVKQVLEMMKG